MRDTKHCRVMVADENEDEPINELLERTVKRTSKEVRRALTRPYAVAQLVTEKPIGIAFVSDQHIATDGPVDVERMLEDAELIQQTPGLYCVLGGDGVNNSIRHRRAIVMSGSTPTDEWRVFNFYLGVLGYKTLAMISGNHDEWSMQFAGVDMVWWLAQKQKIHYAPDAIVLTIELLPGPDAEPAQSYVIKVQHKARYNSSMNLGHAVKRMWEMGDDDFDVGVIAHNHPLGGHVESFTKHGQQRWAIRPGSYQITSDYARSGGFPISGQTCPTIILSPDDRELMAFPDVRQATEYLAAVRNG